MLIPIGAVGSQTRARPGRDEESRTRTDHLPRLAKKKLRGDEACGHPLWIVVITTHLEFLVRSLQAALLQALGLTPHFAAGPFLRLDTHSKSKRAFNMLAPAVLDTNRKRFCAQVIHATHQSSDLPRKPRLSDACATSREHRSWFRDGESRVHGVQHGNFNPMIFADRRTNRRRRP